MACLGASSAPLAAPHVRLRGCLSREVAVRSSQPAREPGQGDAGTYNGMFTIALAYDAESYAVGGGPSETDEYARARERKQDATSSSSSWSAPEPPEPAAPAYQALTAAEAAVLDRFWSLRGVQSAERRLGLVRLGDAAAAAELPDHDPSDAAMDAFWGDFCGLRDTSAAEISRDLGQAVMLWEADGDLVSGERIREISRRALRLHRLLGGEGADVAMMAVKEPRVLDVEAGAVVQRLLDMRAAEASTAGPDIVRTVQEQPSLLLSESTVDPGENAGQRQGAWRAGLVSDNDPAWEARFQELLEYKARVGDAHVGFRDGDNRDLARWCRAQRTALREGRLPDARRARLAQAGFRFDEADAEWLRWYAELKRTVADKGVAYPDPLGDNTNYYLINWCAVQRVAMRCRKLSPEKVGLLESLGFDWSGADPLS